MSNFESKRVKHTYEHTYNTNDRKKYTFNFSFTYKLNIYKYPNSLNITVYINNGIFFNKRVKDDMYDSVMRELDNLLNSYNVFRYICKRCYACNSKIDKDILKYDIGNFLPFCSHYCKIRPYMDQCLYCNTVIGRYYYRKYGKYEFDYQNVGYCKKRCLLRDILKYNIQFDVVDIIISYILQKKY